MAALRLALALLIALLVAPPPAAAGSWRWPVEGSVLREFDYRSATPFEAGRHRGIDVAAAPGTRVSCVCSGRVRFAGSAGDGGRTVSVQCGGLVVSYQHLGSLAVSEGRSVSAGDRLGTVGRSGRPRSAVAHLHLGVRVAADRFEYLDPLALLAGPPRDVPVAPFGVRRVPLPRGLPVRMPPALGPAPSPARVPARVPALAPRPVVAAAPPAPDGWAWPVWAGLGLLALAAPLPAMAVGRRVRRRSARRLVAYGGHAR